jgi:hypothetical protein
MKRFCMAIRGGLTSPGPARPAALLLRDEVDDASHPGRLRLSLLHLFEAAAPAPVPLQQSQAPIGEILRGSGRSGCAQASG